MIASCVCMRRTTRGERGRKAEHGSANRRLGKHGGHTRKWKRVHASEKMEIGRFSAVGEVCSIAEPILAPRALPLPLLPPISGWGLRARDTVPAAVAGRGGAAYMSRGLYAGGCGLGVGPGAEVSPMLCRLGRIGLRGTNPAGSWLSGRMITFPLLVASPVWAACTPASAPASSGTNCCGRVTCPASSGARRMVFTVWLVDVFDAEFDCGEEW